LASGSVTDDNSLSVSGTFGGATAGASLASGETVRIYDGATYLGNATVSVVGSGQSTWSYTETRALANNQTVSYTAQVADAALNQTAAGAAYTVTVDTQAPANSAAVTAVQDNIGAYQGNVASGGRTDDTSLSLSGTYGAATAGASLAAGENLRILDGGTFLGNATVTVVAGGQSTWTYIDTRTLNNNQTVNYYARTVDVALNHTAQGTAYSVTVDTAPPANSAAVTGLVDNIGAYQGNVASGGTTDDQSLTVTGTLGGATAGASLAAGETVRIYDGATYLGNATVTVVGSGQSTWSFNDTRTLANNQTVSYTAQVADSALNQTASGTAYTATVDITAPANSAAVTGVQDNVGSVTGNVASGGRTDDNRLSLSGTFGGATAGASLASGETVRIYDGATYLGNATVSVVGSGQSTWSYIDSRTLANNQAVSYTSQVADSALNQTVAGTAYTITVDTAPPLNSAAVTGVADNVGAVTGNVASGGTTDDSSLSLSGTFGGATAGASLAAGETVRIYDGATYLGDASVSVVGSGQSTWSYTDTRTLANAQTVSYTARVADSVMNETAAGTPYSVTVETNTLDLGTVSGVNLNLINKVTMANGKVYYYLDHTKDGSSAGLDGIDHDMLDTLLNGGTDTRDTQTTGAVKGVDDARTVLVGGYTLVLATRDELTALYSDPLSNPPPGWATGNYWSATTYGLGTHAAVSLFNGNLTNGSADSNALHVAFQVL
jgi:hypothetical protein